MRDKRDRRRTVIRRIQKGKCYFCLEDKEPDYKEVEVLRQWVSDRGKIWDRSRTALCQKHQRRLAQAVKRARYLALLPFTVKPRYS